MPSGTPGLRRSLRPEAKKSAAFEAGIADSMQKTALTQRGIMKALARSKAKPERLLEWGSKMEKKHLGRLQGTELGKHYKDPDEWIHKVPKGMSQAGYEAAQKHVGQTGFAGRQATELAHMRKPNVLESARAQHQATAAQIERDHRELVAPLQVQAEPLSPEQRQQLARVDEQAGQLKLAARARLQAQ